MDVKTPDSKKKQDSAYNPGEVHAAEQFPGVNTTHGIDQAEAFANDPRNHSDHDGNDVKNTKNTDDASKQEADGGGGWKNNYTGDKQKKFSGKMRVLKRKGPMALILGLLFGGGGGMAVLFSPGFAIVQLKEMLVGDLNDQVGATSLRSNTLLRAKLKNLQGSFSICTGAVSVRCKFSTMSKRQVKKFEKAGFKIEGETKGFRGRTKATKITFPPVDERTPPVSVSNPNELRNHLLSNAAARSSLNRAYNPRYASLSDAVASKVFARFKTNKAKKVTGNTDEERNKNMDKATAGQSVGISAKGTITDEAGKEYVLDENGNKVYESDDKEKFKKIADENKAKLSDIAKRTEGVSAGKATSSVLKNGLKGVSLLGASDTACTVYNVARAVAAAAKVARAYMLIQFAMFFLNEADEIKAGTAEPEDTEYIGKKLTAVDTEKTMGSETDKDGTQPNPYYQKNALDSPGYHTAAYNAAPVLTTRDLQYAVGGGLSGSLSKVMDTIASVLGGRKNIRKTCSVVQSWWARSIGLIAGVASAVGSFGTSTAITIGASIAIGLALPFLEAQLADIIKGNVVSSATSGVDAGDAAFAGTGALLGAMAMGHGLKPGNKESMKAYAAAVQPIKNEYIAAARYDARSTPFDVMNQYSFLGSAVRKINPTLIKSTASISGALTNIPSLLGVAFSGIIPHASADQAFNPERYERCVDDAYAELNIDADVFCNVRYQMSPSQLAMDPDDSAKWMIDNDHIEEDGAPKSDDYKDWIEFCTERQDGWGETSKDDGVGDKEVGKICTKNNDQTRYFPVFFLDNATNEGMDNPPAVEDAGDTAFLIDQNPAITNSQLAGVSP